MLTGCKGNTAEPTTAAQSQQENTTGEATENAQSKVLAVYFSATGTTKGAAGRIAGITNADLYEIRTAQDSEIKMRLHSLQQSDKTV